MYKKLTAAIFAIIMFFSISLRADEGMWIPLLLEKYNIADMQKNGFKLTAEDIYSINQVSMKDAIVKFGGCTAEIISTEGLLITNHHCGLGYIQKHSSVEHDYLTNGFWAMSRNEELPNPGASVTFLIKIEDVTSRVFSNIGESMQEAEKQKIIRSNINKIQREAVKGTHYSARISSFYNGNEYYLFVYEIYTDVRLVGAPPSAIGKFGGDTDNWVWPRHTGDFSLFRIYADKNNKPANYSPDNVPYKPKKHFPISLSGYNEGDFTMVFGYPGRTTEYLPSYAVENLLYQNNPNMINLRNKRISIMKAQMEISPAIRIQYASKVAGVANGWKKAIGQSRGLINHNAVDKKKIYEKKFTEWVSKDQKRLSKYGGLLHEYEEIYSSLSPYQLGNLYAREAGRAPEIIRFAEGLTNMVRMSEENPDDERVDETVNRMIKSADNNFKNFNKAIDKKIFRELMQVYYDSVKTEFRPDFFKLVDSKYRSDINKFTDYVYGETIFCDKVKYVQFLKSYKAKSADKIKNDPAYLIAKSILRISSEKITPVTREFNNRLSVLNKQYMKAQMEFQDGRLFYPDANSTLRVTYGKVKGFSPIDAVYNTHYTTLRGIMEKDNPDIYDYDVPDKLKDLFNKRDYGRYGDKGEMHVCFIASNHTSGGNSGSPVINSRGHLMGVNFDRNWEGTMSDIMYDPDQCRNISLDIRFALFIIDKFAGATHLIDELTLVY